jgi:nitronate monooxygenase
VLTEKISGVPVSVIRTPYIDRIGTRAGPLAKRLLKGRKTKHWIRALYSLQSIWKLKHASLKGSGYMDYFQAGKSVDGILEIQPAGEIVAEFAAALEDRNPSRTGNPAGRIS